MHLRATTHVRGPAVTKETTTANIRYNLLLRFDWGVGEDVVDGVVQRNLLLHDVSAREARRVGETTQVEARLASSAAAEDLAEVAAAETNSAGQKTPRYQHKQHRAKYSGDCNAELKHAGAATTTDRAPRTAPPSGQAGQGLITFDTIPNI